jgi:hypothetical protein
MQKNLIGNAQSRVVELSRPRGLNSPHRRWSRVITPTFRSSPYNHVTLGSHTRQPARCLSSPLPPNRTGSNAWWARRDAQTIGKSIRRRSLSGPLREVLGVRHNRLFLAELRHSNGWIYAATTGYSVSRNPSVERSVPHLTQRRLKATVRTEPSMTGGRYLVRSSTLATSDRNDALPVSLFTDRSVPNNDKPAEQVGYISLFE